MMKMQLNCSAHSPVRKSYTDVPSTEKLLCKLTKEESTFVVDGDHAVSSEYVIGTARTSKTYSKLGTILGILESRFGFLFMIIFPILILFIYEIYVVIKELKESKYDDEDEEPKKKSKKDKKEVVEQKEEIKEIKEEKDEE